MKCPACQIPITSNDKECPQCGLNLQPATEATFKEPRRELFTERRYHALRFIQAVYRVLAWILAVTAPVVGLIAGSQAGDRAAPVGLLLGLLVGALAWLLLMSAAEGIAVVIDTEENTRRTADAVAELAGKPKPPAAE